MVNWSACFCFSVAAIHASMSLNVTVPALWALAVASNNGGRKDVKSRYIASQHPYMQDAEGLIPVLEISQ